MSTSYNEDEIEPKTVSHLSEIGTIESHYSLELAVCAGDFEMVCKINENSRIDINAANKEGETPLHSAARNGHFKIVRYFCEMAGIDPAAAKEDGTTSLHSAALEGHL